MSPSPELGEWLKQAGAAAGIIVLLTVPALVCLFRLYVKTVNRDRERVQMALRGVQDSLDDLVDVIQGMPRKRRTNRET